MKISWLLAAAFAVASAYATSADRSAGFAEAARKGGPVVTLDYRGNRLTRISEAPTLSIYPDGRVVMPQIYAHTRAYEGRISTDELQALLHFIVVKNDFFRYDEHQVAAKLAANPKAPRALPGHLARTEIQVYQAGRAKAVSHYGLGHSGHIRETAQLLAVRNRLDQLMAVIRLGGRGEAEQWLRVANAKLRRDHPGIAALSLSDLESGTIHPDGSAYIRFSRIDPVAPSSVSVTFSLPAGGESRVTVSLNDLFPAERIDAL